MIINADVEKELKTIQATTRALIDLKSDMDHLEKQKKEIEQEIGNKAMQKARLEEKLEKAAFSLDIATGGSMIKALKRELKKQEATKQFFKGDQPAVYNKIGKKAGSGSRRPRP